MVRDINPKAITANELYGYELFVDKAMALKHVLDIFRWRHVNGRMVCCPIKCVNIPRLKTLIQNGTFEDLSDNVINNLPGLF